MEQAILDASLRLAYPELLSSGALRDSLFYWSVSARSFKHNLWHMAASLPEALRAPSASFATVEWMLFCRAHAARRALQPFTKYHAPIHRALLQHRVQIGGVFFEHLGFRVQEYLDRHHLERWPDCQGTSPFGFGRLDLTPRQLRAHRAALLSVIRTSSLWFERTLATIGVARNLDERTSGHKLPHWISGAGMPPPMAVSVTAQWKGTHRLISPDEDEARAFVAAGWPLPEYPVDAATIREDVPLLDSPPAIPAAPPAVETPRAASSAFAAEGSSYAIAADYSFVMDKKSGKRIPVKTPQLQVALAVFVELALGQKNYKSSEIVCARIEELKHQRGLRATPTYEVVHHFQINDAGRRTTWSLYRKLIHNLPRLAVYWIAL